MFLFRSPAAQALGLTIAFAGAAGAQQKACEVNESRPSQIGKATLAVQVASSSTNNDAIAKQLTQAVKALTENGERMDNQVGRNFVLGKALVLWSMQPNVDLMTTRGRIGYAGDPAAPIDLAASIDSAFKVVETANPECISETSRWRGQKAWVALVNKAIERLSADDPDAADAAARRAIMMNPFAPYGYVVLANVMQKRNRATEAFRLYNQSVEIAARDTAFDDIRRQSLLYLGNLAADSVDLAPDAAAKKPYVETARTAFEKLINDKDAGDMASNARAGLCRIAVATGDTTSLRGTYSAPLAEPSTFSYPDLMNAGVCMARAEMVPEATKLFLAAYEKNPYHRDALSNLAIMYLRTDQQEKSLPLVQRLVSVEPNNPENIQLLVLSYAGIAKRARDQRMAATRSTATKTSSKAPATKAQGGPRMSQATQDSLFKIEQAFTDSAVKANDRKDKLALKVQLSDFSTNDDRSTVAGSITNLGSESKSVTIHVEFLDREGKVVMTKDASVGPIAAGSSGRFTTTANPGKGISAFRYTIS